MRGERCRHGGAGARCGLPAGGGLERDAGGRNRGGAAIRQPHAHVEALAGHGRRHQGRRREGREGPGGLGLTGGLRRGHEFQPQTRAERVLNLLLLDAQHEERFVFARALGHGVANQVERAGQPSGRGRRVGHLEVGGRPAEGAVDARQLIDHAFRRPAAEHRVEPRIRRVDAVEDRRLFRRAADARAHARVVAVVGAGPRGEAAAVLRPLEAQAVARHVVVGIAQRRAVLAAVDAHRPVLVLAHAADIDLEGLPRPQTFLDLLGERVGIARHLERELRDQPGGLVVAMAIALIALEARQQHERTARANHPHHIAQHGFLAPLLEGLFEPLREAVVDHRGEVLLVDAVVAIGHAQFFSANQAEPVEELRADGVVARLAAVEGHERQPRAVLAAQPRDHPAVLVIGMRGGVHHARCGARLLDFLPGTSGARVLRRNGLGTWGDSDEGQQARDNNDNSHRRLQPCIDMWQRDSGRSDLAARSRT